MTGPTPTFVYAGPTDIDRVLVFVQAYYEFDGIRFSATQVREGLERLLRDTSLGRVWFIRVGHENVGYVVLTFGYDLEFGGDQATVTDFYIVDRYRRQGLGAKTFYFLEEVCCSFGIRALELQVERRNAAAQALYTKLGFEAHDRIPYSKLL